MQVFMGVRKCSSKKILCLHYRKLTIAVLGPGRGLRRKGMLEGAVVVGWACSLPNPGQSALAMTSSFTWILLSGFKSCQYS